METLLPSEVARLIYGYLEQQKCSAAAQTFLETCPLLAECLAAQRKGRKILSRVHGQSLQEIIDDYCDTHCLIVERELDLGDDVRSELEKSMKLNIRVQSLLNAACSDKEPGPGLPESLDHQSTEPIPSTSHNTSAVAVHLPFSSHQEIITESNLPVFEPPSSSLMTPAAMIPSSAVTPAKVSFTPVSPAESSTAESIPQTKPVEQESHKVTTPRPVLTSLINTSPYRKRSPLKRRRSTPAKSSNEDKDTEELLTVDYIPPAAFMEPFLKNTQLHQKIAETINRVLGTSITHENNRPVERENPDDVLTELDAAIHSVVEQTQADPIFERLMDEMFSVSAEPAGSSETDDQTPSSSDRQVSSDGEDREELIAQPTNLNSKPDPNSETVTETPPIVDLTIPPQEPKSLSPTPVILNVEMPPTPQHPSVLTFPETPQNFVIPTLNEADTSKELNTPNHQVRKVTPSASQEKKQSTKKQDSISKVISVVEPSRENKSDEPPLKARLRSSRKKLSSNPVETESKIVNDNITDSVTSEAETIEEPPAVDSIPPDNNAEVYEPASSEIEMTEAAEPEQTLDDQNEAAIRCIVDATPAPVATTLEVPIQDQCYVISTDVCVEMPSEVQEALSNNMVLQQSNTRKDIIELAMANSSLCDNTNQMIPVTSYSNTTYSAPEQQILQTTSTLIQPKLLALVPPRNIFLPEHRPFLNAAAPQLINIKDTAPGQGQQSSAQNKNRLVPIAPKHVIEDPETIYMRSVKRKPVRSSKARARCVRPPPDRNIQSRAARQKVTQPPGQLINVGGPNTPATGASDVIVATVGPLLLPPPPPPPVLLSPAKFFNQSMPSISPLLPQPPIQPVVQSPPKVFEVLPEEVSTTSETIGSETDAQSTSTHNSGPKPTISPSLRQLTVNRTIHNPRRKSLSTPRRDRSHIRTLDFSTPPRGSSSLRKANTSPKGRSIQVQDPPRLSPGTTRKLSRAAKMVRTGLFLSPVGLDNPARTQDANVSPIQDTTVITRTREQAEESTSETSLIVETETSDVSISSEKITNLENELAQQSPVCQSDGSQSSACYFASPKVPASIATRTPSEHPVTRSCWDKVAGLDLILGSPQTPQSPSPSPVRASSPSPVRVSPKKASGEDWDSDWRSLIAQSVESPVKFKRSENRKRTKPSKTTASKDETKDASAVIAEQPSSTDEFEASKPKRRAVAAKKPQKKKVLKKNSKKKSAELVFDSSSEKSDVESGADKSTDSPIKERNLEIASTSISETPCAESEYEPEMPKTPEHSEPKSAEESYTPPPRTVEIAKNCTPPVPQVAENVVVVVDGSDVSPSKVIAAVEALYDTPPKAIAPDAIPTEESYTSPPNATAPAIITEQTHPLPSTKEGMESPRQPKHGVVRNEVHADSNIKSPRRAYDIANLLSAPSSSCYDTPRKVDDDIQPSSQEETPLTKLLREQSNNDLELTVIDTPVFPITPTCILPPSWCPSPPSPQHTNYFPPPREMVTTPIPCIEACVTVTTTEVIQSEVPRRATRSAKTSVDQSSNEQDTTDTENSKPESDTSIQNLLAAAQNRMGLKNTSKNKSEKSCKGKKKRKGTTSSRRSEESVGTMSSDNSLVTDNLENIPEISQFASHPIPDSHSSVEKTFEEPEEMSINVAVEELATSKVIQQQELKLAEELEEKRLRMVSHIKRDFSKKDLPVVNLQKTHQLLKNRNKSRRNSIPAVKSNQSRSKKQKGPTVVCNTSTTSSSTLDDSAESLKDSFSNKNLEPPKKTFPKKGKEATKKIVEVLKKNAEIPKKNVDVRKKSVDVSKKSVEVPKKSAEITKKNAEVSTKGAEVRKKSIEVPKKIVKAPNKTVGVVKPNVAVERRVNTRKRKATTSEEERTPVKNNEIPKESLAETSTTNSPQKPDSVKKAKEPSAFPSPHSSRLEHLFSPQKSKSQSPAKHTPRKNISVDEIANRLRGVVGSSDDEEMPPLVYDDSVGSPCSKESGPPSNSNHSILEQLELNSNEKTVETEITNSNSEVVTSKSVNVENQLENNINVPVSEHAGNLNELTVTAESNQVSTEDKNIADDICVETQPEVVSVIQPSSRPETRHAHVEEHQVSNESHTNSSTQQKQVPKSSNNVASVHMHHEKIAHFKHLENERKIKRLKLHSEKNTKICISFSPIQTLFSLLSRSRPVTQHHSSRYDDRSRYHSKHSRHDRSSTFRPPEPEDTSKHHQKRSDSKNKESKKLEDSSNAEKVRGVKKKSKEVSGEHSTKLPQITSHHAVPTEQVQTPRKDLMSEDDLMTYALVGSVRETSPEPTPVQAPVESHTLPLKKRPEVQAPNVPSAVTNQHQKVDNPQDMLRKVGLDNFLSVLHGNANS